MPSERTDIRVGKYCPDMFFFLSFFRVQLSQNIFGNRYIFYGSFIEKLEMILHFKYIIVNSGRIN